MMLAYSERILNFLIRRRIWIRLLAALVVLLALVYLGFVFFLPVDHDEVEHAHVAFKMLNGQIPYRDFYQNHLPAYWLLVMQPVRAFPFSVKAILAGRAFNLLALAACWLLGLRLLKSIRGGHTWFGLLIYTFAIVTVAFEMKVHEARPDPMMMLISTAGLCLIPLQGKIAGMRALFLGMLFGLALSVSPKALTIVWVLPALVVLHCIRDRRFRPLATIFPYSLGVVLGLLPTAWWIFQNGLVEPFYFDVFGLNRALRKSWHLSINYLLLPIFLCSLLGALVQLGAYKRRLNRYSNAPAIIALVMTAGLILALLSRHAAKYNLQVLIVFVAVGFVSFVLALCQHIHAKGYQLLLCAALIGYPAVHVADMLVRLKNDINSIQMHDLQMFMDLAKPGNRTCTAFSPSHPLFCHDVSGLSNGWDLFFAEGIRDPQQLDRFRKLWHEGIRQTLDKRPDIILRRSPHNCWERAVAAGLIKPEEIQALDALGPAYIAKQIGPREVWIRRQR